MNRMMNVAGLALMGLMAVGCNSTPDNPVKQWQKGRYMAQNIQTVYDSGNTIKLEDVTYKAKCASLNALSPASAALYIKVVKGVDKLDAELDGIELVREMNLKTAEDADPRMTQDQVFAEWDENSAKDSTYVEARDRYNKCVRAIKNSKTDTLIPMIEDILKQLPPVAAEINRVLEEVKKKNGMLSVEAAIAAADAAELLVQHSSATAGAKHWLALAVEAHEMRTAFKSMANVK